MNSTSAELVSIQALCPASAAASAFALTLSSVGAGVSGACASAEHELAIMIAKQPPSRKTVRRLRTSSANRCIEEVSYSRRVDTALGERALIDSAFRPWSFHATVTQDMVERDAFEPWMVHSVRRRRRELQESALSKSRWRSEQELPHREGQDGQE